MIILQTEKNVSPLKKYPDTCALGNEIVTDAPSTRDLRIILFFT